MKKLMEFQKQVVKLQRDLTAAQGTASDITNRLEAMKAALDLTPAAPADARERIRKLIASQRETIRLLNGDSILRNRNENVPDSIAERVGVAAAATRTIVSMPTGTQREQFEIARKELDEVSATLRRRVETDVKEFEALLEKLGAPWTPGRLPGGGK
jgi:chromosome segregation ATPase